ncbi:hypothetical protein HDV62DRAFT_393188 [Trichoderma sp. SZMC 28011]
MPIFTFGVRTTYPQSFKMQLSALLALLPLAAALPQSRGPVEARAVEVETRDGQVDGCTAQHDQCRSSCRTRWSHSNAWFIEPIVYEVCYKGCDLGLLQCNNNATEKRSVEEAPVETRNSNEDNCQTALSDCSWHCPVYEWDEFAPAFTGPCHNKCVTAYEQCTANQTEKRSVEEAPVEARYVKDVKDECDQQFDKCCFIPPFYTGEMRNMLAVHCPPQCYESFDQCRAKPAEKRSVEARDNGSEATTACYGKLAACKHKGTPVAECYGNLSRCVQDVYQKFFG